MILTDYFRSEKDASWDYALQSGIKHGVIRLPETDDFDICEKSHWQTVYGRFTSYGITPVVIEPMPNSVHDHIKTGDEYRDQSIEKVIKMFPIMDSLNIRTICFNWMAHIGWLRTSYDLPERGGAQTTGFNLKDFKKTDKSISEKELWDNYAYFLNAVIPEAERYGIKLELHPDDPPIPKLGGVSRIMISAENIKRAVYDIRPSEMLGITMCQATYYVMGGDLEQTITDLADKIFFIHFRNVSGTKENFRETFHDNGVLDMPRLIRLYNKLGIDVPIRVDHVPTYKDETTAVAGYALLGRLFAVGYLKGLLEADLHEF